MKKYLNGRDVILCDVCGEETEGNDVYCRDCRSGFELFENDREDTEKESK